MKTLENKKILFFCPAFRNYDEAIKNKLIELGADVIQYSNHPHGLIYDFILSSNQLRTRFRSILENKRERYIKKISREIKNKKFDIVFVIKGDTLPKWFLTELRNNNKSARFVLYQWDSLKALCITKSDFNKLFDLYDFIFSFDPVDCQNIPGLIYRPSFYIDNYGQLAEKETKKVIELDLFSVGVGSHDRFYLMKQIANKNPTLKFKFYLNVVFFSKYIRYVFCPISGFTFYLKNLPQDKILHKLIHFKAVVDVPSSYQNGLTMRTFETLAAQKKLITTNKNILNEPFYHPDNILVISNNDFKISKEFLEKPFVSVDLSNHSLDAFLTEILIDKQ